MAAVIPAHRMQLRPAHKCVGAGRMTARSAVSLVLPAAAFAAPAGARADVWGFIDERGAAHFASEQLNARYQLFFRGGESFDTTTGLTQGGSTPSAVAMPMATPKLIAFFEASPSFKQVKHRLREASTTHGIDFELLQALIATEAGFDTQAVSPKGAIGLVN